MFDNCMETNFIPKVIVLCGNFTSVGVPQGDGREIRKYQGKLYPTLYPRCMQLITA